MFSAQMPALQATPIYEVFSQARVLLQSHQASRGTLENMVAIVSEFKAAPNITMLEAIGEQGVRVFATQLHQTDPDTLNAPLEGTLFSGFDPANQLAQISAPTHVVAGNVDRGGAVPLEDVLLIHKTIPDCSYVIRSDVGHDIHGMMPQQFLLEVDTFVSSRI